jgi:hypothetical protein
MSQTLMEATIFNVNHEVRVRLKERGRAIVAEERPHKRVDADGWSTWQLWDLMQCFGPHIVFGGPVPFETNIELLPDAYCVQLAREAAQTSAAVARSATNQHEPATRD